MPAAKRIGSDSTAPTGRSPGRGARRHREEPDLRCGVETEAEQDAQRIHLPAVIDEPLQPPAKQAIDESALRQQFFQVDMAVLPRLRLAPQLEDIEQDNEIEDPDQKEERAGYAGADDAAEVLELGQFAA